MNEKIKLNDGDECEVGYVQLPLTQKGLGDFVNKLLGEPQRVQGILDGEFLVDINGIEKLNATIMQRIEQQNKATLIEFVSKIYFENDTNITIKGLDNYISYKNIEDLKVVRLDIHWSFLIQFEDKGSPEKQSIRICFDTGGTLSRYKYGHLLMTGGVLYEISYTARTWGIDIENLIRNAVTSTFLRKNRKKEIVKKIKIPMSLLIPIIIYVIVFIINNIFVNSYLDSSVQNMVEHMRNIDEQQKIQFIAEYMVGIPWYQFTLFNNLFLIVMFVICMIFGLLLDDMLDNVLADKCHIFLANSDEIVMQQQLDAEVRKYKNKYFITLFFDILCGVLSNFVFQILLEILK